MEININKKKINLSSFSNVKQIELEKAYTEGVYCDSPANRKLGRVGMTYAAYAARAKRENGKKEEESIKFDLVEAERGIYDLHPNPVELKTTSSYVKKIPASESKYGSTCYEVFLEFKDGKKINSTSERLNNQTEAKKWIENEIKGYDKEKKETEDKKINLKQELEKTHASTLKKDDNGNMVATFETSFAKAEINKIPASMTNKGHNLFQPTITSINGDNKWRSTDEEFSSKEEAEKWIKEEISKYLDNESTSKKEDNKELIPSYKLEDQLFDSSDGSLQNLSKDKITDMLLSGKEKEFKFTDYKNTYLAKKEKPNGGEEIINYYKLNSKINQTPSKKKDDTEEKKKLSYMEARTVLSFSDTLANATTRQLNNVIDYSGFDIDKKFSDDEKREKLAQKYYKSAELYEMNNAKEVANALDEIIEDALEDYVPPKK